MKTKRSFLQKIVISIFLIILCVTMISPYVEATDDDEIEDEGAAFGGVLLSPIVDLFCSIGDFAVNFIQILMTGEWSQTQGFGSNPFLVSSSDFKNDDKYKEYKTDSETTNIVDTDKFDKGWLNLKSEYYVPLIKYNPEMIFKGHVSALDINFIGNSALDEDYKDQPKKPISSTMREAISSWYVSLRNLAIVGLLSVLVYVGIRIILSSTAADKAKYKQLLQDWLIALCLLFFMHYIMSFTVTMTKAICEAIGGGNTDEIVVDAQGENGVGKFKTSLMGFARFQTQYKNMWNKLAYLIMYLALVIYTIIFTVYYLKRVVVMAFLTMIAPLVALTYPIDKIQDGKAQAFDAWLKEYVYNALIQPFHLIIYMVLVGSAQDLASENLLYVIVALGFIPQAEKLLRYFFGFNKAGGGTLGPLGALGLASIANKAFGGKPKARGRDKGGKEQGEESSKPVRFKNSQDLNEIEMPDGGNSSKNSQKTEENATEDSSAASNANFEGSSATSSEEGSATSSASNANSSSSSSSNSNFQSTNKNSRSENFRKRYEKP